MPSTPEATLPPRRRTIAITAAVASTTLALGATAASLLGWFSPRATATEAPAELAPAPAEIAPASSPPTTIFVPIAPTQPPAIAASVAEPPHPRPQDDGDGADDDERRGERDRARHGDHDKEDDDD